MDPYYTGYYPNAQNPNPNPPPVLDPYAYSTGIPQPTYNPVQGFPGQQPAPGFGSLDPNSFVQGGGYQPSIPDPYGYQPPVNNPGDFYQAPTVNTPPFGGNIYGSYGSGGLPPVIPDPNAYATSSYNSVTPTPSIPALNTPINNNNMYGSNLPPLSLDPYASLLPFQFPPGYEEGGQQQQQQQQPEEEEIHGKTKETGSSLLGKLALKVHQVGGVATSTVASKASNVIKKMNYEVNLVPPPAGYEEEKFDHLTKQTKFTLNKEIEFLYYEFKTHLTIPKPNQPFKAVMSFDQFYQMLPRVFLNEDHYKIFANSVYKVFLWGSNELTFDTYAKAMGIICRGTPAEKLPLIYDMIMDPYQRIATPDSTRFSLNQLVNLSLNCPSAGNAVPSPQDVENLIMSVFINNAPVPLQQFNDIVLAAMNNPYTASQPCWAFLMDFFGLFPFFFYQYFEPAEQFAHNQESVSGRKPHKEGFLIKQHKNAIGLGGWNNHWTVVDSGFMYYYPANNNYDQVSRVEFLGEATVRKSSSPGDPPFCFELDFGAIKRKFCAPDEEHLELWLNVIQLSCSRAKFPNHSFAPVREGTTAQWFIDGKDTYASMADALESATEQIFITDWFFSPQVYLRRYNEQGQPELKMQNRLDYILKKKAMEDVKIYVLPWSETKIAIDLASANVKAYLESLHPKNIKVMCHPLNYPIKWSHHQKTIIVDQKIAFVGGLDTCFGRWDDQVHEVTDKGPVIRFPGKDYYNPGIKEFSNVQEPRTDLLNRECEPRMPWHDIHMRCEGDAARDVATNFIQRWNHHHMELKQHKPIIPKTSFMHKTGNVAVQVVRSICSWSAGVKVTEQSILNAYLEEIEKAENFIYIENQFFISSSAGPTVENTISQAIMRKVMAAAREKRKFRVIVIVPVHPEGGYKDTMTVRYIMGWQFKTFCEGSLSMVETFRREFSNDERTKNINFYDYFNFYIIKNWGVLGERLVSEQIYVHAKLMIVDDRTVIVGSANINDRSMLGTRDSEIAVVVKDRTMIDSKMNGVDFKVARYAHDLRVNLFLEHLGLTPADYYRVQDPICDETYNYWLETARANTLIFNELFYKTYHAPNNPTNLAKLQSIRGHLAEYDRDFLEKSEYSKSFANVDIMLAGDEIFV